MWIWLCCYDTVCLEYEYTAMTLYVDNMNMFQWHNILCEYECVVMTKYVENMIVM